jgi:hypothetical protein
METAAIETPAALAISASFGADDLIQKLYGLLSVLGQKELDILVTYGSGNTSRCNTFRCRCPSSRAILLIL